MPDVYGNPYLPSFVRNQPKIADPTPGFQTPVLPTKVSQINSVQGFSGAHQYAASLANGSSEILAETDPDTPRVYVVVVDQNGQRYVQGFRLVPEEEPKPVTMDDLNDKMSAVLERLERLEAERKTGNGQPNYRNAEQSKHNSSNDRNAPVSKRPDGGNQPDGSHRPENAASPAGN